MNLTLAFYVTALMAHKIVTNLSKSFYNQKRSLHFFYFVPVFRSIFFLRVIQCYIARHGEGYNCNFTSNKLIIKRIMLERRYFYHALFVPFFRATIKITFTKCFLLTDKSSDAARSVITHFSLGMW